MGFGVDGRCLWAQVVINNAGVLIYSDLDSVTVEDMVTCFQARCPSDSASEKKTFCSVYLTRAICCRVTLPHGS